MAQKDLEALMISFDNICAKFMLRITQHKQDAEDVVQQTFVSVIKNLKNFRGNQLSQPGF